MPGPISSPIIDSFTRADENPLSGAGLWAGLPINSGHGNLQIISNVARGVTAGANNSGYIAAAFAGDQECYLTGLTNSDVRLFTRISSPNTTVPNFYSAQFFVSSNSLIVTKTIAGVVDFTFVNSTMVTLGFPTLASGDRYGFRATGGGSVLLEAFIDFANTGTWTAVWSGTDTTPQAVLQGGGFMGAFLFDSTAPRAFDNFGGAVYGIPVHPFAPVPFMAPGRI